MKTFLRLVLPAFVLSISVAVPAQGAEPNEDFATATGPLTAGQIFKSNLETTTDLDFQFFYLPDPTTVSLRTANTTKKRGGAADRGREIVSSVFRARKGKDPIAEDGSLSVLKPGQKATVKLNLLPGKYFIPVGHNTNAGDPPLADVDFSLRLSPVGSTTDSYEIFQARCRAAHRKVERIRASIERTTKRIAKAEKNDAPSGKIVKLKLKLRDKRAKAKPAKKAEKFACSIPQ